MSGYRKTLGKGGKSVSVFDSHWWRHRPVSVWLALAAPALILLWYSLLPTHHFQEAPLGVWLEGPIPAWLGACLGLWRHRARRGWRKILAVAAYAALGQFTASGYLSSTHFGLLPMPEGFTGEQFDFMHSGPSPLSDDPWQWDGALRFWVSMKLLLLAATVTYWVMLALGRRSRRKAVQR